MKYKVTKCARSIYIHTNSGEQVASWSKKSGDVAKPGQTFTLEVPNEDFTLWALRVKGAIGVNLGMKDKPKFV